MEEYYLDEQDVVQVINYNVPDLIYDEMQKNFKMYFEMFLNKEYNIELKDFESILKDKFPEKFI